MWCEGSETNDIKEKLVLRYSKLTCATISFIFVDVCGIETGCKEGFENEKIFKLSNLIMELERFPEIKRIRYTTSHPRDMTDDLINCYQHSKKLMPLLHLPVQSGSNNI